MIKETKGYQLLEGYRGEEPASILALVEMILRISDSTNKNPQIRQIELNPVFAYKNEALARDARMILEGN